MKRWTDEEKEIVATCHAAGMSRAQVLAHLPGRSMGQLRSYLSYHGMRQYKRAADYPAFSTNRREKVPGAPRLGRLSDIDEDLQEILFQDALRQGGTLSEAVNRALRAHFGGPA